MIDNRVVDVDRHFECLVNCAYHKIVADPQFKDLGMDELGDLCIRLAQAELQLSIELGFIIPKK